MKKMKNKIISSYELMKKKLLLLSGTQNDFDVDPIRNLNSHQLPECAFISIEIDETFVNSHLPAIPGF